MQIQLAGEVRIGSSTGAPAGRLPGRLGRLAFAYLVSNRGRQVPRDELAEVLWPAVLPATWDKTLTVLASKIRTSLSEAEPGAGSLLTSADGCYRLELPAGASIDIDVAAADVDAAEALLAKGSAAAAAERAASIVPTLRRQFLPGEDADWVQARRRELASLHLRALECEAEADLRRGRPEQAARVAREAISLEQFRESSYVLLMRALAAAGNRAEALRVYEACRRLVAEELGVDPSPATEAVYLEILKSPEAAPPRRPARTPGVRPRRWRLFAVAVPVALLAAAALILASVVLKPPAQPQPARRPPALPGPAQIAAATIRTIAGTGVAGYKVGITGALDAELDHPQGIAVDSAGDVYIADTGNSLVRELLPNGSLQDVIGGGDVRNPQGQFGPQVRLNHPTGLYIDSAGDLYIADTGDNRILRVDTSSHVWVAAGNGARGGSGDGGLAVDATLDGPTSAVHGILVESPGSISTGMLIIDSGNLRMRYATDQDLSIQALNSALVPALHAGGLPAMTLSAVQDLYYSDSGGGLVYEWRIDCGVSCGASVIAGDGTTGYSPDRTPALKAQLDSPEGIALDKAGRVYIADTGNDVVRMLSEGRIWTVAGTAGIGDFGGDGQPAGRAELNAPAALAIDARGDLFIADTANNRIREVMVG